MSIFLQFGPFLIFSPCLAAGSLEKAGRGYVAILLTFGPFLTPPPPVLSTRDSGEGRGCVAILPRFGPLLIFSPCLIVGTPEKINGMYPSCPDLGTFLDFLPC